MSEDKKKTAIQKYNEEIEPEEEKAEIFQGFAVKKSDPQEPENETRLAASPALRAQLKKMTGLHIRDTWEKEFLHQEVGGKDAAGDNIQSYADKQVHKVAKRNGIIFESDLEGSLTRKILFKLTNYILIAVGIFVALMSGSNPSIQAAVNNVTKSPIEILGVLAFVSLDLYIFFTWYRKQ